MTGMQFTQNMDEKPDTLYLRGQLSNNTEEVKLLYQLSGDGRALGGALQAATMAAWSRRELTRGRCLLWSFVHCRDTRPAYVAQQASRRLLQSVGN